MCGKKPYGFQELLHSGRAVCRLGLAPGCVNYAAACPEGCAKLTSHSVVCVTECELVSAKRKQWRMRWSLRKRKRQQ